MSKIWNNKPRYEQDIVRQFLITKDGKKVIFLGKKYHYIFDNESDVISKLLSWQSRNKIQISGYDKLEVNSSNEVKGLIRISAIIKDDKKELLSSDEIDFIKNLGFKLKRIDNFNILEKRIKIKGLRYLPEKNTTYQVGSELSKEYKIKIEIEPSILKTRTAKIALTPIAATTDAGLVIVGVGVVVVVSVAVIGVALTGCAFFQATAQGNCSK